MCRSRRELSNEYLLAKVGVDTAENEPLEVWGKIFNIIHWCPYAVLAGPARAAVAEAAVRVAAAVAAAGRGRVAVLVASTSYVRLLRR